MSRGMRGADGAVAEAGLHRVRDQRLDRDDLAALGLGRNVDEGAGHQIRSSRQAPSVMMTSARSDQNEPSDSSAIAMTVCVSASRMRVRDAGAAGARPEVDADHVGLRVLLVEDVDRLDVVGRASSGCRPSTAHGTVLPFSTSGGMSSLTLPRLHLAPRRPPCAIAACIAAGVALRPAATSSGGSRRAGSERAGRLQDGAPRGVHRSWSLHVCIVCVHRLVPQRRQKSHHILDLLRVRIGLPRKAGATRCKAVDAIIGRHDRVRVEPAGIDDPQPQLSFRPARAGALAGPAPIVPWNRSSGNGPEWQSRHKPDLPVGDDGAAARRIALLPGQRRPGSHRRRR